MSKELHEPYSSCQSETRVFCVRTKARPRVTDCAVILREQQRHFSHLVEGVYQSSCRVTWERKWATWVESSPELRGRRRRICTQILDQQQQQQQQQKCEETLTFLTLKVAMLHFCKFK